MKLEAQLKTLLMPATAIFAMAWVITRAAVQAITIDEGVTVINWVSHTLPTHWLMTSNNHVLNSMLMRLSAGIFGVSQFTVRLPAIMGAAAYIAAAYALTRMIAHSLVLRWSLFVCMVYCPFVMDYLVAARGYALASAGLLSAVAVAAWWHYEHGQGVQPSRLVTMCAVCSVLTAASVAANFSFAIADAAVMLLVFLWALASEWRAGWRQKIAAAGPLLAASVLPGFVLGVFLVGPVLKNLKSFDMVYGAASLREMLRSIIDPTMYELNREIVNEVVYAGIHWLQWFLWPALGIATLLCLFTLRRRSLSDARARWLAIVGSGALAAGTLVLAAHYFLFRMFHILLPKDRTGLYFVPLAFLIVGTVAALPAVSRTATALRSVLTGLLVVMSCYFLLSLRLDHFKEWSWNGDLDRVYAVLADYNHKCGLTDVMPGWRYDAGLNFYRFASGRETFPQFRGEWSPVPGRAAYVLYYPDDHSFIDKEGLKVVYHNKKTEATIAIRPGALPEQCVAAAP